MSLLTERGLKGIIVFSTNISIRIEVNWINRLMSYGQLSFECDPVSIDIKALRANTAFEPIANSQQWMSESEKQTASSISSSAHQL